MRNLGFYTTRFFKFILSLMLLVGLLPSSGCGKSSYSHLLDKKTAESPYTVKDSAGFQLDFSHKPTRIVSLGISSDEILIELVPSERIAALSFAVDDPVVSNIVDKAKAVKHRVRKDSPEAILALRPDLVIVPDFVDAVLIQTLRDLSLPVYQYKTPECVKDVEYVISQLAQVVGEQENGRCMVKQMEQRIQKVLKRLGKIKDDERKGIILMRQHGVFFSPKSNFKDICWLAGAQDVTQRIHSKKRRKVSQEEVLQLDPDIIFIAAWDRKGAGEATILKESILTDPSYKNIKAVKTGQVYEVNGREVLAVSQYIVDAIETVAEYTFPDK